mgnify:CR=1 FL=1
MKQDKVTTGMMMIKVADLEPHERALNFWPDSEERRRDAAAIAASIAKAGVRRSLLVTPKEEGGGYWVIDGCTRLAGALAAGIEEVPCEVRPMRYEDIDDEVFVSNMDRSRFGTGLRVMKYLERNANEVLAAANEDQAARGRQGGRGNKGTVNDSAFSAAAISARLGVSNKDVLAGVELLRCRLENKTVRVDRLHRRELAEATDEERAAVDEAYRRVLEGMSLRRWLPAAKGHGATAGRGKAETDYAALAERASTSLVNALKNWGEADWTGETSRKKVERQLAEVMGMIALSLGTAWTAETIKTWWTPDMVNALVKGLK